jgi:hypothetical protein
VPEFVAAELTAPEPATAAVPERSEAPDAEAGATIEFVAPGVAVAELAEAGGAKVVEGAELTKAEVAKVFAGAGRAESVNGVAEPELAVAGDGAAAAGLAVPGLAVAELSVPELTGTELVGAELVGATVVPGTSPAPDAVAGSARSKSATAVAETVAPLIASGDAEPPTAGAVVGRLLSGSVAVPRSSDAICASGPSNGSRGSGARSASGRAAGSGGPSGISGPASLRGSKGSRGTREAASIVRALQ